MTHLQRQLYSAVLRLHPAAFRAEFGREMLLDFEEAQSSLGFRRLCMDALLSLARQWMRSVGSEDLSTPCDRTPSLLAGHYLMIRDRRLNAMEWSRGLLASVALLLFCGYTFRAQSHITNNTGVVYAAIQAIAAAQSEDAAPVSNTSRQNFTEFDVATVRENKTGTTHVSFPLTMDDSYVPTHGFMQMIGLPLLAYIQFAYKLNPNEITAIAKQSPDWAGSARYDIEARLEGDPSKDDLRRMLRALLIQRFNLRLHPEIHVGHVYDLVLAKPGKTGPTLHEHPSDDTGCKQAAPEGISSPCGTIAHLIPDPEKHSLLRMMGRDVSLAQFVWYASPKVDRTIVDKTGLTGKYDFTLDFVAERTASGPDPIAPEPLPGPSFTEALHDQMGLKLVPDKGPVTTYVLDHVEKPSEN
ncbi:MAG TPA: TIGR03435 family protein [Acidobacteriaceae bacterium]